MFDLRPEPFGLHKTGELRQNRRRQEQEHDDLCEIHEDPYGPAHAAGDRADPT